MHNHTQGMTIMDKLNKTIDYYYKYYIIKDITIGKGYSPLQSKLRLVYSRHSDCTTSCAKRACM